MLTVSWFSAGVSSAVATKLMIDEIDRIIYTHIDDQHEDTLRFVKDCEQWFGKPVEILQSPFKTVDEVCRSQRYINGVAGAPCTKILKRKVRQKWEYEQPIDVSLRYVWGMDCGERERANRIPISMPNQAHVFPLIERSISKQHAHQIMQASGIKRPALYDIGLKNNNCIGCVKASGASYWNLIRREFPSVFESRRKLEEDIGASMINGTYLKDLDPDAGRDMEPIVADCGILCEIMAL